MLFNNTTKNKYDFNKTPQENLAAIYSDLVDINNKPVTDLIFKNLSQRILFAVPVDNSGVFYNPSDPSFILN